MRIRIDKQRALLALSAGLLLSVLFGFGAWTQQLFLNGILGQATSVYEAMTPEGFMQPMTFLEWISAFYFIGHLPLAVLGSYFALGGIRFRKVFTLFTLSIFVILTLVDLLFRIFADANNTSTAIQDVLSNALGAPFLSFVMCMLLHYAKKLAAHLEFTGNSTTATTLLILSALVIGTLYVITNNLFPVTKSSVSARLKLPFEGNYIATNGDNKFGILTGAAMPTDKFAWTGKFLNLRFASTAPEKVLTGHAYGFEGCPNTATEELLKKLPKPIYSFKSEPWIALSVDDGLGSFSMRSGESHDHGWTSDDPDVGMFSIESIDKEKFGITKFVSEKTKVTHAGWTSKSYYRFDAFLLGDDNVKARYFAIATMKGNSIVTLKPEPTAKVNSKFRCLPLRTLSSKPLTPHVTLLLELTTPAPATFEDLRKNNQTTISGLNGWLSIENVSQKEFANYISSGEVGMLSLQGKFEDILIDQEQQNLRERNWLYVQGDKIKASWHESVLSIDGKTELATIEGSRLSKTRWEKISPAIKWLFALVPIVLGFVFRSFLSAWNKDESFVAI